MIKNKIVRGIFLIVACSAAAALISCQDGGTTAPTVSKTSDEIICFWGYTLNGSIQPPQIEPYVEIWISYCDGFGWVERIWVGESNENGYYKTDDLSYWSGKPMRISAFKEGFAPYGEDVYLGDGPTRHDIYLLVAP